ncbi:phenylacetate--CoA ligase family protein [Brenneria izbisi]|uniref:Uncharacterized protein n=1 Tax=Brenneria izbisi TaxID=2939450 RepID=A0AA41Y229_9GAMM|nr:hypothetical protein [Brenneria izbisi]MCV9877966.1 hypothetical protein [Brenneria izbisi]MCV9881470.1 hypothetical protein [Brenneria izbisi]
MYAIFKERIIEQAKKFYHQHYDFNAGNIGLEQLYTHQNNKIRDIVKYAAKNTPVYREPLKGLASADIEALTTNRMNDLPFTIKDDQRNHGASLASAPLNQSWIYYEATGATGKSTPCPRNEIDLIHNNIPLIIYCRNIFEQYGSNHIVGGMGPSELHSIGDTFEDVLK